MRFPGISRERCHEELHLVDEGDQIFAGAAAVRETLERFPVPPPNDPPLSHSGWHVVGSLGIPLGVPEPATAGTVAEVNCWCVRGSANAYTITKAEGISTSDDSGGHLSVPCADLPGDLRGNGPGGLLA